MKPKTEHFRLSLILPLLAMACAAPAFAGFSVPRGVFEADQLDEALVEASKKGKAVALILSDPGTACSLCANASKAAMDEVSRYSVVVLLRSGREWGHKLPPPLAHALGSEVSGSYIPRLAVASPRLDSVWATMSYEDLKDSRKLRGLRGTVNDIASARASAPEPDPVQRWMLKDGRFYRGAFVGIEGDRLVLKIQESGNEVRLPLDEYAPGTITYARTLAGQDGAEAAPGESPAPESPGSADSIQEWTSSEGKVIRAHFVALEGSTLSLRGERGESLQVDLGRLSEESRSLARSLAGR